MERVFNLEVPGNERRLSNGWNESRRSLQPVKRFCSRDKCEIAFIQEALTTSAIENARILCVECDDATRTRRLTQDRLQPELADESMRGWSRYLHQEAVEAGCQIPDTTHVA